MNRLTEGELERLHELLELERAAIAVLLDEPGEPDGTDKPLRSRLSRRLARIQHALARIEDGTYGRCLECGCPITLDRLSELPYAELCFDCKRAEEAARGRESRLEVPND